MSKAFWEGFREGYLKTFWIGIALLIGIVIGSYLHPYESCMRIYDTPESIVNCVWVHSNG